MPWAMSKLLSTATSFTWSGVEIPKPTANGTYELALTRPIKSFKSDGRAPLAPVTPVTDTQYINEPALVDRYEMRSLVEVGETRGT